MKKIYYILIVVFLVSCTSNTIYEKPKDLIPKDTMVSLLTDLYLASSATNVKNKNLESSANYAPIVYKKYNIDSTRFKRSNIYYLSKMDEYEELFLKVKDTLKALEKVNRKIADSVKTTNNKVKIPEKVKKLKIKDTTTLKNQYKSFVKKQQ